MLHDQSERQYCVKCVRMCVHHVLHPAINPCVQAMALSQLPVSIMEATLFSCIIYFMVGFHLSVSYFFIFWAVVVASNLCLTALFRLLAVLAPNPTLAAAYGGLALLILILTSGFAIVRGEQMNAGMQPRASCCSVALRLLCDCMLQVCDQACCMQAAQACVRKLHHPTVHYCGCSSCKARLYWC